MSFRDGFLWGVSTSSYQVEGAAREDGKGLSIWDVFCRKPGAVRDGHTGDVACDHYRRYGEDVALARSLGVNAMRFSLSWPRVLPDGVGAVNVAGLDFYERLVDELLRAGVRPFLALYHWDLPWALHLRGGWLNRDIAEWFADYARVVVDRLSDRVTDWITFVEPAAFLNAGYGSGQHAPGTPVGRRGLLLTSHHVALAHGRATQVIRRHARRPPRVSLSHVGACCLPATDRPEDIEAARLATAGVPGLTDPMTNAWLLDPIYLGAYPEADLASYGDDAPAVTDADLREIHQRPDFFALNYYNARHVRRGDDGRPALVKRDPPPGHRTAFGWTMEPEGLYWLPRFHHARYGVPIVVTENGMANLDWPSTDGAVHDPQRIDFHRRHLLALRRAAAEGAPVEGYFVWSLLDNFEWAEGYHKRFGLVYVDFDTQLRIPKDSARWYARVAASNGAELD